MINKFNVPFLDYLIFSTSLTELPTSNGKTLISTINQYSYCIAEKDWAFKKSLLESDVLLPDGIGIVWAAKYLYQKKIRKIAGADLHEFLLNKLNKESGSCFYLGSSENTLSKISERLSLEYPNISFSTYSPPFKQTFSKEDNEGMIEAVNAFNPDVLFVGMTAPKQEKWSCAHKETLNAHIICSIGAVFDFYAGTVNRPSKIWINLGLEWLGRLLKEPKRMWKRYIYYGFIFLKHVVIKKRELRVK